MVVTVDGEDPTVFAFREGTVGGQEKPIFAFCDEQYGLLVTDVGAYGFDLSGRSAWLYEQGQPPLEHSFDKSIGKVLDVIAWQGDVLIEGESGIALVYWAWSSLSWASDPDEEDEGAGSMALLHYRAAMIYDENGLYDKALDLFAKVIEAEPDNYEALYESGYLYTLTGEYDKAIETYTALLSIAVILPQVYLNRGFCQSIIGNLEDALEDFGKVLELDPGNSIALVNRGLIYFDQKKYVKAEADLLLAIESAKGVSQEADALFALALVYFETGRKQEARVAFEDACMVETRYDGNVQQLIDQEGYHFSDNTLEAYHEMLETFAD
jgi:tetratricopeptide (TPR) repeat protein